MGNLIDAAVAGGAAFWSELTDHEADSGITASDQLIQAWYDIYRGSPSWQDYTFRGLKGREQTRTRRIMNAGRMVCHELCTLIWTERPKIGAPQGVLNFLDAQSFYQKSEEYSEYGAALGGYVYKLYADDGELKVDYVKADRFIPRSWTSSKIIEADFISDYVYKNQLYKIVEEHRMPEPGTTVVKKEVYKVCKSSTGTKTQKVKAQDVEIDDAPVTIISSVPLFAYVRYPGANNLQPDTPLGMAMYANAPDTLETLDLAFDNLMHEIETSRRKIVLPSEMVEAYLDPIGGKAKVRYNPDEETYVAFNSDEKESLKPVPIDFELRIDSIAKSIQTALNILSVQVGFSAGYLSFDTSKQAITATQVISENSKTYKTKTSYENTIGDGIKTLITAIQAIGGAYGLGDLSGAVNVQWNDNIIEDRDAKATYWTGRYEAGTCTLETCLMHIDGIDEVEAAKRADAIRAEQQTVDVDTMYGGSE